MLVVASGVGHNQSLKGMFPRAELHCGSVVWIKCRYLVPLFMLRFNFRQITSLPCANTPAAANEYLPYSSAHCLFPTAVLCLSVISFQTSVSTLIHREEAKHCTGLFCLCSHPDNKAEQHLCRSLNESGCMQSAALT